LKASPTERDPLRVLITAGPTHEAIDPVRFIGNRSSGKMGFALAEAAVAAGHEVTLIAGPVKLSTPAGVHRIDVTSAAEMYSAVASNLSAIDTAILCAAVADFTPVDPARQKIKKSGADTMTLELVRTSDILGSMREPLGFIGTLVGFAAETENLITNATDKLLRKGCDFLVANDVSIANSGFESDNNSVTLLSRCGEVFSAAGSKRELAIRIIEEVTASKP